MNYRKEYACFVKSRAGACSCPTLFDIICTYKSLTTRICNQFQKTPGRKIFQTSYYEEIIRNEQGYYETWQYIDENPMKWNNEYF